ncbi:MAG: MFS transporter [Galbitalea sp.]
MGESFGALRVPNFRLFTASNIVAMSGTWMQRIAQDWLVLTLSHSVAAVGITVAAQFLPMLLFGLYGGLIVDRYSKRMLLMVTQSTLGVLALILATLALTHTVEVWHVYLLAFLGGFVVIVDNPARQVFVNELVGPRNLRNAIAINSSVFQLGGLIGPAIAGVLLDLVGAGWAFAINGGVLLLRRARARLSQGFHAHPGSTDRPREGAADRGAALRGAQAGHPVVHRDGRDHLGLRGDHAGHSRRLREQRLQDRRLRIRALQHRRGRGALAGGILATRRRVVRLRTVVIMGASGASSR